MLLENKSPIIAKPMHFKSCVVCLFKPTFYFGFGTITPAKFRCDHSQIPIFYSMELSWLSITIATILLICNLILGSLNIYGLYKDHINSWDDFLLLDAITIHFLAAYLLLAGIRNAKLKINELHGIAELTKHCENAGLIVFDESFVRVAHYMTYACIVLFVSLEVVFLGIFFIEADFSYKAFKRLCANTCIFLQGTVTTHFMLIPFVVLQLFQVILSEIKLAVENRLNNVDKTYNLHVNDSTARKYFLSKICHLHRLYRSAHLNFMQTSEYINGGFLVWWNVVLANNVICVYVILNSIMTGKFLKMEQIFFILLHCGTLCGLTIFLIVMGMISNVVSYLSFNTLISVEQILTFIESIHIKCFTQQGASVSHVFDNKI